MIRKGDKVYIVPRDTRYKPYYTTIKSVGPKYITVDDNISYSRFNALTFDSVCDRTGWNPQLKMYLSKEEYERKQSEQTEHAELCRKIQNLLSKTKIERLRDIYEMLKI